MRQSGSIEPSSASRAVQPTRAGIVAGPRALRSSATATTVLSARARLGIAIAVLLTLVLAGSSVLADLPALRIVTVTAFLLLELGIAPVLLLRPLSAVWFTTLAFGAGLAVLILGGLTMAVSHVWHPQLLTVVLALTTIALLVPSIRRDLRELRTTTMHDAATVLDARRPRPGGRVRPVPLVVTTTLAGLVAVVVAAIIGRTTPQPGGLFSTLGPLWYAGLALLVAAAILAYRSNLSPALPVVVLSTVVVLSQAITYGTPAVMSAARHVGIVDYIRHYHGVQQQLDIYQSWSGLFAGVAWLTDAAGITDVLALATWWPVLLSAVTTVATVALASRFLDGRFRIWFAALLFSLTSTLNISYFSPQSVGLILAITIFALAVSPRRVPTTRRPRPVTVAVASASLAGPDVVPSSRVSKSARLPDGLLGIRPGLALSILVLSCAMAVTHQISPYLTAAALFTLMLFGFVRPWWLPVVVLAPAALWALSHSSVLGRFVTIEAIGRFWENLQPPSHSFAQSPQPALTQWAFYLPAIVLVILGLFAVVTAVTTRRRLTWALLLAAASPLSLIVATDYGQEGIFRVTLFAGPWLAILAAALPWTGRMRRLSLPALSLSLVVLLGANIFGQTALDWNRVMSRDSADATEYFELTAKRDSTMLLLGTGNATPQARTYRYLEFRTVSREIFGDYPSPLDAYNPNADLASLTAQLESELPSPDYYALVSTSIGAYDERYGFQSYSDFRRLAATIARSAAWKPVFVGPTTTLYKLDQSAP